MLSPRTDSPPVRRPAGHRRLFIAGLVGLALWAAVWGVSVRKNRLLGGRLTWAGAWEFLGLDFLNPCLASRHWLAGGDPYREPFGDPREGTRYVSKFCYPPLILPLFAWCGLLSPARAVFVWMAVLAALAGLGGYLAWRTRRRLGLYEVPLPFLLAALFCSTPLFFALERGNCDLLILPPLALAAAALQRRSVGRDVTAGTCLALAVWIKLYPGLLALSLPALRRWRALACFVIAGLVIGLPGLRDLPGLRANLQEAVTREAPRALYHVCHPLSSYWQPLWEGSWLPWLTRIPGTAAAAVFVLGLGLWVSYRVSRCPDAGRVLYPYLLWLAALATFLPRTSNDYNFYYLPLAVLAVWDRRDPVVVHMAMGLLLLWWQPLAFPVGGRELFACKVLGFLAVTRSLLGRVREQAEMAASVPESPAVAPAPARPLAA